MRIDDVRVRRSADDLARSRRPPAANLTEFGKSQLVTTNQLSDIGCDVVIYPVTTLRLVIRAAKGVAQ